MSKRLKEIEVEEKNAHKAVDAAKKKLEVA